MFSGVFGQSSFELSTPSASSSVDGSSDWLSFVSTGSTPPRSHPKASASLIPSPSASARLIASCGDTSSTDGSRAVACAQLTSTASRMQSPSVSELSGWPPSVYSSKLVRPSLSLSASASRTPLCIETVRFRPKLTSKMSGMPSLSESVTLSSRFQSAYHESMYGAATSVEVTIRPISRLRTIAESPQLMLEIRTDSPSTMAPLL